jgi:DNA uptake protein ComE-like DNA-binding protein
MRAFLMGLGVGVGLGMLFAPDRGEITRRKVRGRVSDLADDLERQMDKAKDGLRKEVERSRRGTQVKDREAALSPKKGQASEIRSSESSDPINTLTREELLTVNGIGPVLADNIISNRPYSSPEEVVQRGILSQNTFEELDRELLRRPRRSA